MTVESLVERLERFGGVLPAVVSAVSEADARWRPAAEHWSVLEVCRHLLDEEREDFRPRLQSVLRDPAAPWPKLELEGIAERRNYNQADLKETVAAWASERRASVAWLRSLDRPDWEAAYQHPSGAIRAGDLLASWAAHDALHLRQVSRRLYELASRDGGEFSTEYAGAW